MIRRFDGSNAEAIKAEAKRGRIIAVGWTWQKHRIVPTKASATRALKAWKRWYERRGCHVVSSRGVVGYMAYTADGERHSVSLHEYDAVTLKRIYPEHRPAKERVERETTPRPRRGRKPVGA